MREFDIANHLHTLLALLLLIQKLHSTTHVSAILQKNRLI